MRTTNILSIKIGNAQLSFDISRKTFYEKLKRRYSVFLINNKNSFQIIVKNKARSTKMTEGPIHLSFNDNNLTINRFDFEFNGNLKKGHLKIWNNLYSFDTFLRVLLGTELLRKDKGILLHSVSTIHNGKAFIFPGISGSGKTTLARMHSKLDILTDELSLITKNRSGSYTAWATPFWGEFKGTEHKGSGLVAAIAPIKKGKQWKISDISHEKILSVVMRCLFHLDTSSESAQRALEFCQQLICHVPCYIMTTKKDKQIPEEIYENLCV